MRAAKLLFLLSVLLAAACVHTGAREPAGGEGQRDADRPDDAIEEDAILRTFDDPAKKPTDDDERAEPVEAPGELDRTEEKEDTLVSTIEPRKPPASQPGEQPLAGEEELDTSTVREDPILSLSKPEARDQEGKAKKEKRKGKKEKGKKKNEGT